MIRIGLLLALCILTLNARALDVSLTHCAFKTGSTNYVEIYIQVVGITTTFDTLENGNLQAAVESSIIIQSGEEIFGAERFILRSPEFDMVDDFIEVRRFVLPNNNYTLKAEFADLHSEQNRVEVTQPIEVNFVDATLDQSGIRLLSSFEEQEGESAFHRNGYFMEPLPFNFYHRNSSTLVFYNEIYDADKTFEQDYMVTYSIVDNSEATPRVMDYRHVRLSPLNVNALLSQLDISKLPSGNYEFKVEVKDRNQTVFSTRTVNFTRSNPLIDLEMVDLISQEDNRWLDTLNPKEVEYAMKAAEPIMSGQDVVTLNYLLDKGEEKYKRNFLHFFWSQKYGQAAGAAFGQYMQVAKAIDVLYRSGMGYGFETDRGRIYLKYGRPDESIRVEDDQGAFPYEIWYFSKISETGQTDVRFMFFNPELATNHFILLTSNCRGERNNRRWERILYRNASSDNTDNTVDATTVTNSYRRRARELYEN